MSRVSSLFRLQSIDLQIDRNRKRLSDIERLLSDSQEVKAAQNSIDQLRAKLESAETRLHTAEHQTTLQQDKIQRSEKKLYAGAVTDPKELHDLQKKVVSLKKHFQSLEEVTLDKMILHEDAVKELEKADVQLDLVRARFDMAHSDLTAEQAELQKDIDRFNIEKDAALAVISEEDIAFYQLQRGKSVNIILSLISEGNCDFCGSQLADSILQQARSGNELIRCRQCSRILYAG